MVWSMLAVSSTPSATLAISLTCFALTGFSKEKNATRFWRWNIRCAIMQFRKSVFPEFGMPVR